MIPKPEPIWKPTRTYMKGWHKCKMCGVKFRSQNAYPKYCSRKCAIQAITNVQQRTCKNCGNVFDFKPSQLKAYPNAGKYCSRECGYQYRTKVGASRPIQDKYGRSARKADKAWQKAVRERDNCTCQRCGIFEKYIHTHHIAPRSQRPDLKHDPANGVSLCGSCHIWVHHHPYEAQKLGFLSGAKYEQARLEQRYASMSESSKKGRTFKCPRCGVQKYYSPSRPMPKIHYRCPAA